jgi:hypothetical protein
MPLRRMVGLNWHYDRRFGSPSRPSEALVSALVCATNRPSIRVLVGREERRAHDGTPAKDGIDSFAERPRSRIQEALDASYPVRVRSSKRGPAPPTRASTGGLHGRDGLPEARPLCHYQPMNLRRST